jgi:hypothetical protein
VQLADSRSGRSNAVGRISCYGHDSAYGTETIAAFFYPRVVVRRIEVMGVRIGGVSSAVWSGAERFSNLQYLKASKPKGFNAVNLYCQDAQPSCCCTRSTSATKSPCASSQVNLGSPRCFSSTPSDIIISSRLRTKTSNAFHRYHTRPSNFERPLSFPVELCEIL